MLSLLNMRQLDRDAQHYSTQADITIVPPLCPLDVSDRLLVWVVVCNLNFLRRRSSNARGCQKWEGP